MKKYFLLMAAIYQLAACTKSNTTPPDPVDSQVQITGASWVITIDASPTRYTYIRTNLNNMFRKDVDKTYSLYDLKNEDNCEFFISETPIPGPEKGITIQLDKNKNRWCFLGPSTNKQEMHMGMSNSNSITIPPDESYKFILHRLPSVNNIITAAIESVAYPGYYMSASPPGFNYAANQMTFTKEISPDKATGWQFRRGSQ